MNIAVNTRFLLKDKLEGIGRFTYEITRQMVLDHPEDTFYFLFDRAYDASFIFAKNIVPIVVNPPARHPILYYLWFEWAIPRVLKKWKIDVFLSTDGFASLSTPVPTIMVTHDIAYQHYPQYVPFTTRKYYQYFVPKFHRKVDHICCVSQATLEDVQNTYGVSRDKLSIVHNSCSAAFGPISEEAKNRIRQEYTTGQKYFIYVGSVHPRKNVRRVIEAFNLYCEKNGNTHKLVIAGRWAWQTEEIEKTYENSPFKMDIIRLEHLTDNLPQVLAAADTLIYVSRFEGFGIPLLEAMHCDVPFISSNISSMPEVAGEAGILVDPEDTDAIANAMERIISDEVLYKSLLEKGREQRRKFSWKKSADRLYEEIAKLNG